MGDSGPSSLPFLPLELLGPLFATYDPFFDRADRSGFLGAFAAGGLVVIVGHHAISGLKNVSLARLVLMGLFLVMVAMFVAGQTAALTFTSVSSACMARNMVLTAGDQFAHIAGTVIGLSFILRNPSQMAMLGLLGWTVLRVGIFLS